MIKWLVIIAIVLGAFEIGLLIFDRPLFCKIAMLGSIQSVPVACLQDALQTYEKNR